MNQQYLNTCYKYAIDKSASFTLSHFTGKAFVSFQYQHFRDYFLREYLHDKDFLKFNNKRIKINNSSKPSDIFWENMKITDRERRKTIIYSYIVLFMTLVIALGGLLGL